MAIRMQQRRGTAAQWISANPTLAAGEIGFETDTGKFKMGNGQSAWLSLSYFTDSSDFDTTAIESTIDSKITTAVNTLLAGAPAALDTLNEIANAINNDGSFATTVINSLNGKATQTYVDTHINASTNVHGIADTSVLATQTYVTNTIGSELASYSDTTQVNSLITTALGDYDTSLEVDAKIANELSSYSDTAATSGLIADALQDYSTTTLTNTEIASQITTHSSDSTNVHGISDTANLVYTNDSRLSDTRTPSTNSVTTATILDAAVTTSKIQDSAVTTSKLNDGAVTSAKIADGTIVNGDISASAAIDQSKVANLTSDLALKAPLAGPTFTGTVVLPSTTSIGNVSSTELGYLDGVTSAVQTQIDSKLASATASSTYAPLASPALTGTPTAPTATAGTNTTQIATTAFVSGAVADLVASAPSALNTLNELATALGNDANFSTTITNSLAAKAPLASPTFTGTVTVSASGVAFTDGTQTKEGVPSRTPIVQKTAAYTLSSLSERDNLIEVSSASAVSVTIPTNASVAYPVGTSIDILQTGAGQVSIVGASGVTVNCTPSGGANTAKLRSQWSSATLFKRATDTWVVMGDLTA